MTTGRLFVTAAGAAWRMLIFLLPVSSMPLLVFLVGSDTVAAPSGLFLLLLILIWLLPYLFKTGTLSKLMLPLLAFAVCAAATTAASFFLEIPPFKSTGLPAAAGKALLTLAIGLCFYLVSAAWPDTEERFAVTFRWLNWGGLIMLLWSLLQAVYWYSFNRYPDWMREIHALLSVGPFYRQRVTGFTLEPSWLAHQLNMIYLPYWLASSFRRYTAHKFRLGSISLENIFLAAGAVMMFLTLSRVGQAAFLMMLAYLVLRAAVKMIHWIENRVSASRFSDNTRRHIWISFGVYAGIALLAVSLLFGLAFGLSRFDRRMAEVFSFSFTDDQALLRYADRLNFGARVAYWQAGWEVFNDYPWLGVGLGNAGYFFPQKISSQSWSFFEVRSVMLRSPVLPNIKSLWVRILAETGLVGFALFAAWLFVLWKTTSLLQTSQTRLMQTMGLMGIFVLIGIVPEGFSIDSFALPYFWVSTGLLTAACQFCYNNNSG